jgi:hypothetical protein
MNDNHFYICNMYKITLNCIKIKITWTDISSRWECWKWELIVLLANSFGIYSGTSTTVWEMLTYSIVAWQRINRTELLIYSIMLNNQWSSVYFKSVINYHNVTYMLSPLCEEPWPIYISGAVAHITGFLTCWCFILWAVIWISVAWTQTFYWSRANALPTQNWTLNKKRIS